MAKPQSNFEPQASRLRGMVSTGARIAFRAHALAEMEKDGIARLDVEVMLGRCKVTLIEDRRGEETWRAEGVDFDGHRIVAVVVCKTEEFEIKVITSWAG